MKQKGQVVLGMESSDHRHTIDVICLWFFSLYPVGSNWIDLKCSSQYVLTSLPPITKQSPTEGLVQAYGSLGI